jgi:hypothetical protein
MGQLGPLPDVPRTPLARMDPLQQLFITTFDHYAQRTVDRFTGLTDDEYFWEPAEPSWSVRKGPDGWQVDGEAGLEVPPVTTIAWRLVHVIYCLQDHGMRPVAFEQKPAAWGPPTVIPPDAATALTALDTAIAAWRRDLEATDDTRLWVPLGDEAGPYAKDSVAAFVEHIHDELIHHTAEIALLRDLYRAKG